MPRRPPWEAGGALGSLGSRRVAAGPGSRARKLCRAAAAVAHLREGMPKDPGLPSGAASSSQNPSPAASSPPQEPTCRSTSKHRPDRRFCLASPYQLEDFGTCCLRLAQVLANLTASPYQLQPTSSRLVAEIKTADICPTQTHTK